MPGCGGCWARSRRAKHGGGIELELPEDGAAGHSRSRVGACVPAGSDRTASPTACSQRPGEHNAYRDIPPHTTETLQGTGKVRGGRGVCGKLGEVASPVESTVVLNPLAR
jgi:hypothetical protein